MEQREDLEINLGFLVREVVRKAWIIVLATIVCAAGMFCFSNFVKDPVYESSVKVYVNNISNKNDSGSISNSEIQGARYLVDTYISILKTYDTLNLIAEKSGVSYTADQILKMISAGSVNSTEIFYISVKANSPEEAYKKASSIIEVLPKRISDIINGSEVSVVQYPLIPAEPSGPNKMRDTLIGAVLGFVISCALIVVYKIFDKRINDDNYPSDAYGIKALANIPSMTEHSGKKIRIRQ